ncbi:tetratricopeptide repeat protein [Kordiimonas gwangyangensis]|uniref:tetratricopeptide repeat protein n=1 Tax=Kordiimonas gwangyangensis TaxID=288022 RepID=UPI00039A3609|nr:tetratricopeptide repeat protein [Kordiimonas gwangyangensis]
MKSFSLPLLLSAAGLLAACGGSDSEEKEKIDYAAFDDADVKKLVDGGDYEKALEIIKAQDEMEISDKADFMTATEIYLSLMDGVAAEVAIEKARDAGASEADVSISLGRALMLQGKFDEAENILKNTEFEGEDKFQAFLLRGDISEQKGKSEEAVEFYEAAAKERPEDFRGHLGLALLYLNNGQLDIAKGYADTAASLIEADPIVSYVEGAIARYQGRTEEAKAHLLKATELHKRNMLAYFELIGLYIEGGEMDAAQKQLDAVYAIAPNSPMAQYYSALMLAIEGKPKEAEYLLLRTGDFTRTFPPAARTYGHVAFELGKYSTAQPYLERSLQRAPADRPTRLMLVECLTRRGQPARALLYLEPLIGEDSTDVEAMLQAAAAYGAQGKLEQTRAFIERANRVARADANTDPQVIQQLGQRLALSHFISGEEDKAISELQALYSEGGGDIESLALLANMQMENGDLDGAVVTAERVVAIDSNNPVAHNLLGAIEYRKRNLDGAIEHYNKAIEANGDYQSALKNRGLAFLTSGKFEQARDDFNAVLSKGAEDAQVHAMLGRAYLELGNGNDAATHLKQAEAIIPESAIIATDLAEAMALSGFKSSAITQAKKARKLGERDRNLVLYLDDLIAKWEKEEALAKIEAEAEREKRRAEAAKKREAEEKARQAIIDDGSLKDEEEKPEDKPKR